MYTYRNRIEKTDKLLVMTVSLTLTNLTSFDLEISFSWIKWISLSNSVSLHIVRMVGPLERFGSILNFEKLCQ